MVVGKVIHYFDKIGVAVVKLEKVLAIGETVKILGHEKEMTQVVSSMQVDHRAVTNAKPKEEVAIKVDSPVKEGDVVERE